jgi:hypothetical protein
MAGSRVPDCVNAAVDALKASTTLTVMLGGAKVYTHVVQNTPAPYVFVMGGDELPWAESMECQSVMGSPGSPTVTTDGGDHGSRQVEVWAQCVSTERGSLQVDAMASEVLTVLTDPWSWSGISGFEVVEFLRNGFVPPAPLGTDATLWFVRTVQVRVIVA